MKKVTSVTPIAAIVPHFLSDVDFQQDTSAFRALPVSGRLFHTSSGKIMTETSDQIKVSQVHMGKNGSARVKITLRPEAVLAMHVVDESGNPTGVLTRTDSVNFVTTMKFHPIKRA
jgi:hypothetical protein